MPGGRIVTLSSGMRAYSPETHRAAACRRGGDGSAGSGGEGGRRAAGDVRRCDRTGRHDRDDPAGHRHRSARPLPRGCPGAHRLGHGGRVVADAVLDRRLAAAALRPGARRSCDGVPGTGRDGARGNTRQRRGARAHRRHDAAAAHAARTPPLTRRGHGSFQYHARTGRAGPAGVDRPGVGRAGATHRAASATGMRGSVRCDRRGPRGRGRSAPGHARRARAAEARRVRSGGTGVLAAGGSVAAFRGAVRAVGRRRAQRRDAGGCARRPRFPAGGASSRRARRRSVTPCAARCVSRSRCGWRASCR